MRLECRVEGKEEDCDGTSARDAGVETCSGDGSEKHM